ncbi:hypothetical protein COV06_00205 [Candidatus Uhrbacteria bacterium CG10_big_fil_rev_8_21_14_0_10_50_16]|uniref:Prepilin peptidase n=1 Tax=Candidatus Uhrbacteria bacterium CG10_big_fil_rev_8_21_14_0_10_50_16 TaxID=1975039 RepID=A0A2H0RP91_9BACT|nr:MAG: hypothetical protein COV06_00205 [Candidatus Uhrbacteria bacterium CG10_big_fil_rev_8_21_14_0_10_50_16]
MIVYIIALLVGILLAGLLSAFIFRAHSEWVWMRPKKACVVCEVPRTPGDLIPIVGDLRMQYRCRSCRAYVAWQYPLIEVSIVLLVLFHVWRYVTGTWTPDIATNITWVYAVRDIIFSLFLLIVFVYDFKYELILDRYTLPAMVFALIANISLGSSGYELCLAMLVLFLFFLIQYVFSKGRILGAGDVRMGLVIGAMLGFTHGIGAVLLAYILGAIVGIGLLLTRRHTFNDQVPFGTFLAIATFIMLVWGDLLLQLLV